MKLLWSFSILIMMFLLYLVVEFLWKVIIILLLILDTGPINYHINSWSLIFLTAYILILCEFLSYLNLYPTQRCRLRVLLSSIGKWNVFFIICTASGQLHFSLSFKIDCLVVPFIAFMKLLSFQHTYSSTVKQFCYICSTWRCDDCQVTIMLWIFDYKYLPVLF